MSLSDVILILLAVAVLAWRWSALFRGAKRRTEAPEEWVHEDFDD